MCYAVLSCIQLFSTPWTIVCQAPLTMGFPRQLLEWVAISFSRGSSWLRDRTHVFCNTCIGRQILYHCTTWKAWIYTVSSVAQSCQTLCKPMDCSMPGFSVHGILQARILKWVAMPSSRGSSWLRDRTHVCYISFTGNWVLYNYTWEGHFYIPVSKIHLMLKWVR